ncbi:phospho-2-dehydro-3-deoxyheptonate aldolase AroG [Gottschalkia purinilytica]|uniref:Phospho-2-dehydro-3-deoxyheptonate aldolase n=1 Tax=Gottschalkia purinilytica TaxID=1503 RepID=A0A0L0WBW1_GOTPU|nr:3-deoxy-7-phosphoheptulonate synthase [Gottschalkia purinilytica]KNF08910.1 phospho-2-dehydro-3-deoxyheptonate aldolase AroG [Gottschalkia purinilytica]
MSFKYINKIPNPEEIIDMIPLEKSLKDKKAERDRIIKEVFEGTSDKFILIIGPCSADFEDSVCEYVSRLAEVQEKVKDKIIMIPRIYTNKPRTTGEGYKGMMHQPNPNEKPNLVEGIKSIRRLHIRSIKESGLTSADEMLYPLNYPYVEDLLSYVAIGARSVENQQHRLTVSGMNIPAGMKNPTSGDISVMFNSIKAAQISHNFIYNGYEVETSGNLLAHSILRGAVNQHGENIPNYHYEDLALVSEEYEKRGYPNPAIIVDTNHSNSMKKFDEQPRIAMEVMKSKQYSASLNKLIKGFMIESYLVDGRQDASEVYGKSITDPCLGWEKTEKLIYNIAEML